MDSRRRREVENESGLTLGDAKTVSFSLPEGGIYSKEHDHSWMLTSELVASTLRFVLSLQALFTNSCIDERGEAAEEEEDHTYELLLTAQTKVPPPSQESKSNKGACWEN